MTRNPLVNAASAALYIGIIYSVMTLLTNRFSDQPDTAGAPLVMLSLLTLSAGVMAVIFFAAPLRLYAKGKAEEGLSLALQTIGYFAIFTLAVLILIFGGVI